MTTLVKASHLLVKTEEEALKLKEEIEAGKEFAQAAMEVSLCPSGQNDGKRIRRCLFFYGSWRSFSSNQNSIWLPLNLFNR